MKDSKNWIIGILIIALIVALFIWHPWGNGSTGNVADSTKKTAVIDTTKKATVAVDTTKKPCPCLKKKVKKSVTPNPSKQTKVGQTTKIPTQRVEIVIKQEGAAATTTTSQQIVAAPQLSSSASTAPSSVVSTLCGLDNYINFSVRLNDNDGNYFPQIAYDRDGKTFNHAVSNPTKDGLNFKFYLSEFVDAPNGDVCVTKDGRICIPVSYIADYIGPDKIIKVILWSGTVRGFHQMTIIGDNYVWQK